MKAPRGSRATWGALLTATLISACSSPSSNPAAPTQGVAISNLRATSMGLRNVACQTGARTIYSSIDDLGFDFVAKGQDLVGAWVYAQGDSGPAAAIGRQLRVCSLPMNPCDLLNTWCIVSGSPDGRGSARAFIETDWTPAKRWQLSVHADTANSNELSATVSHGDGLPYGDRAGVIGVDVEKCARSLPSSSQPPQSCGVTPELPGDFYGVTMTAYHPGLAGRRVELRLVAYAEDGHQIRAYTAAFTESTSGMPYGLSSSISTAADRFAPPFRVVGSLKEFQGTELVGQDEKAVSYP